jgi:hypothetical protein
MTIKYSNTVKDAKLDAIETAISTAPLLSLWTGSVPTATTDANTGTMVAQMTLPSDWMAASSGGVKAKSGTWQDTSADNAGTVTYFRIHNSGGTLCHIQGTVSNTGGGGDMTLDNNVVGAGQAITVSTFSITTGN